MEEVDWPTAGPDEVLVRVRAAALNPTDYVVMRGFLRLQSGWRRPRQQFRVRGFHDLSLALAGSAARLVLRRGDVKQFVRKVTRPDLLELSSLVEVGSLTPVVDRTYPLAETPAAMSYLMARHPRGKVVVTP